MEISAPQMIFINYTIVTVDAYRGGVCFNTVTGLGTKKSVWETEGDTSLRVQSEQRIRIIFSVTFTQ